MTKKQGQDRQAAVARQGPEVNTGHREVWTPHGLRTLTTAEADAYEADLARQASELGPHARRLKAGLRRAAATICLLFAALQALCTVLDAMAGAGAVQLALGLLWAVACAVCGLETLRGPRPGPVFTQAQLEA